jgi:hypothetical protein
MSVRAIVLVGFVLAGVVLSPTARADQARDFMLAVQPEGTDALVDVVFPGVQTALEHRVAIYGLANQLTLRANALYTVPFYESQADVELRILVLTLGASVGVRSDFRALSFGPNESLARGHRRRRDIDGRSSHETWGFGEGRATVVLPLNDYVLFNAVHSLRAQDQPDRTFDWRTGVVHDGSLFKSDITLLFKHREWGGLGPMLQVLNFDLRGTRFTQLNYGAVFVTRPGFRRRDDIFFAQLLFHPGATLGSYDNDESYGMHLFFAPITFTIAYRMVLPIWRPE